MVLWQEWFDGSKYAQAVPVRMRTAWIRDELLFLSKLGVRDEPALGYVKLRKYSRYLFLQLNGYFPLYLKTVVSISLKIKICVNQIWFLHS